METKDIRLKNLIFLLDKYTSKQAFAEHVDMAPAHVSQIVSGYRSMGNVIARRIEEKVGLPIGYMDSLHEQNETAAHKVEELASVYTLKPEDTAEEKALEFADLFEILLEIRLSSQDKRELFKKMKARYLKKLNLGQKVPESENEMEAEVIDFIEVAKKVRQ